ncbi:hypothetical protein B0H67DRAFT_123513 [Lasiosphaeris hirsuta]|uniref:Uncharacterized protein n=1 Tax=Lasiosphaeris hirsuta TaxID=260670 RepID=A0AA40E7E3_9PEZI|nr:hypothetical protein B0H67DRAFT_123513 [Lasiosphaeris hirsuta]
MKNNPTKKFSHARVKESAMKLKFRPGDSVYLIVGMKEPEDVEGPYTVAGTFPAQGEYQLCHNNGQNIKDGERFNERSLKRAS